VPVAGVVPVTPAKETYVLTVDGNASKDSTLQITITRL
jgi:hypothetical protein